MSDKIWNDACAEARNEVKGCAAYTKLTTPFPGYINATRNGDRISVSVRGDSKDGQAGPYTTLELTLAEWREFLCEVEQRRVN